MRDLRKQSRDLTHLREEQSEPTSPIDSPDSPISPKGSSIRSHHAEATEIVDECTHSEHDDSAEATVVVDECTHAEHELKDVRGELVEQVEHGKEHDKLNEQNKHDEHQKQGGHDDHRPGQGDDKPEHVPLPAEESSESKSIQDESIKEEADRVPLTANVADEPKAWPEEHLKELQYVPPTAESVNGSQKQGGKHIDDSISSIAVEEGSNDEPEAQDRDHSKQRPQKDVAEDARSSVALAEQQSEYLSNTPTGILTDKHPTFIRSDVPLELIPPPTPGASEFEETPPCDERHPAGEELEEPQTKSEPAKSKEAPSSDVQHPTLTRTNVANPQRPDIPQSASDPTVAKKAPSPANRHRRAVPAKGRKPSKRRSIPIITIQRPSYSGLSAAEGELPAAPLSTPEPHTVDIVLSEGRYVTKHTPLKKRLEEERKITAELTAKDRERIVQEIATNMASLEPNVPDIGALRPNRSLPTLPRVKRRMKIRGKVVRGPVLKLLLGRQLGGPTKQALKLATLGDIPTIPDVAHACGWPNPVATS